MINIIERKNDRLPIFQNKEVGLILPNFQDIRGHKSGYSSGDYYILGENPPSEIFIVNQNKSILERLKKGGKTLTIKGHYTIGTDHFMIEKIDGKKYPSDALK